MATAILSVNAGSSTLKFSLYLLHQGQVKERILSGCVEGLEPGGTRQMRWSQRALQRCQILPPTPEPGFAQALRCLRELLATLPDAPQLAAVAHRVVHGGANYRSGVVVDDEVLQQLEQLNSLAPLHQPQSLAGIRAFRLAFADLPQVACFDTAFHATLSELDYRFALPEELYQQGVRRYGFHGLSYQYVMATLAQHSAHAQGRVVMAHLGNGASLCAALECRSRATSMGFSALDGLMMGTRSGSLDAGVLLYLMAQGWDRERLQELLYQRSGLLGVSGLSADMRKLRSAGGARAKLAIDLFTHRLVSQAGALVAGLQGLDVLSFSGGIGEHDVTLRAEVCQRLAWLGIVIDPLRNARAQASQVCQISAVKSRVEVWVIPTDEGLVVAREAAKLLGV